MESLFSLCEAMDSDVNISDLRDVMNAAIESGHEQMLIVLGMVRIALELSQADKASIHEPA